MFEKYFIAYLWCSAWIPIVHAEHCATVVIIPTNTQAEGGTKIEHKIILRKQVICSRTCYVAINGHHHCDTILSQLLCSAIGLGTYIIVDVHCYD